MKHLADKKANMFIGLLLTLLLVFVGFQISNASSMTFKESNHARNENYPASFKTYSKAGNGFTFAIEQSIFDEEIATGLFIQIEKDYECIINAFGDFAQEINVYIVPSTVDGGVYTVGNNIFSSMADIQSEVFRPALIQASIDLTEPWQSYGAQAVAFEADANRDLLIDYYANANDLTLLSLFAGYFSSDYCDAHTLLVAQNTALDITSFIIQTDGLDAFLACPSTDAYADIWLDSLGIERDYQPIYDLSAYKGSLYYFNKTDCPFVMDTGCEAFRFNKVKDALESPKDIMELLHNYSRDKTLVLDYLKENAPLNYPRIIANCKDPITVYFGERIYNYRGHAAIGRRIYALDPGALLHEAVHFMIPPSFLGPSWRSEGIDEYLTLKYTPKKDRDRHYRVFFTAQDDDDPDLIELIDSVVTYYEQHSPLPTSGEALDEELFFESYAIATLTNPSLKSTGGLSMSLAEYLGNTTSTDETVFNYPEAYLFTKYLVENHGGLDHFLTFAMDGLSFETSFGMSFASMKSLWLTSLETVPLHIRKTLPPLNND